MVEADDKKRFFVNYLTNTLCEINQLVWDLISRLNVHSSIIKRVSVIAHYELPKLKLIIHRKSFSRGSHSRFLKTSIIINKK